MPFAFSTCSVDDTKISTSSITSDWLTMKGGAKRIASTAEEHRYTAAPLERQVLMTSSSIFYSFGGRQGFLTIAAEMRDPSRDYVPALIILQAFAIPMYLFTGEAIYGLAGHYVTSPALGSAPLVPAKAAYGILMGPCSTRDFSIRTPG